VCSRDLTGVTFVDNPSEIHCTNKMHCICKYICIASTLLTKKFFFPIGEPFLIPCRTLGWWKWFSEHFVWFCTENRDTPFRMICYNSYGMYLFVNVHHPFHMICYQLQFLLYVTNLQKVQYVTN
jgi:hypothetical protein